jgi:hypothetical protein
MLNCTKAQITVSAVDKPKHQHLKSKSKNLSRDISCIYCQVTAVPKNVVSFVIYVNQWSEDLYNIPAASNLIQIQLTLNMPTDESLSVKST